RCRFKPGERIGEQGFTPQLQELFLNVQPHPLPLSRCGDQGSGDHRPTLLSRLSSRSKSSFRRVKIMRPAVVCRTLVTATSTFFPTYLRALSTTTMVPSSR